eukprot:2624476-Amphidinium_carterae.1
MVQGGCDLSFGGAPVEAAATHRATKRRLGLTQHVHGHVIFSFEEDVAGDGVERHETAFHESGVGEGGEMLDEQEQEQQELAEMKVPVAPTEEEKRNHKLTHYPYKEWCAHCVRGRGREDRHHTQKEMEQQGTPVVQLDYSFLTNGEAQVP